MKVVKGVIKRSCIIFAGFLDAIIGIVQGDLTVKEAYNFNKGSRAYQKKQKEEENKKSIEKMRNDIHKICKNICEDEMCM